MRPDQRISITTVDHTNNPTSDAVVVTWAEFVRENNGLCEEDFTEIAADLDNDVFEDGVYLGGGAAPLFRIELLPDEEPQEPYPEDRDEPPSPGWWYDEDGPHQY